MTYITDTITYPHYHSKAFSLYFKGMKLGAADIETTGLNPEKCRFVLGGLLTMEEKGLKTHQFFAEELSQEQEILQSYLRALKSCDVLLTYNGHRFDLPFIRRRAGGSAEFLPYNLDLYLLVKNYSPVRKFLPNLKQKTVENFMGLWEHRRDEISGGESVELYYRYLSERDPSIKQTILLHNHDDIIQLYRLLWILEKCDLHRAMYHMGFPICSGSAEVSNFTVEEIFFSKDHLCVRGRQGPNALNYRYFEWDGIPCSAQFSKSERSFFVSVPIICHAGMKLADLQALKMDISLFEKYPGCQEGFLILKKQETPHYLEINHFVKVCLERILNQWIIKKSQQM